MDDVTVSDAEVIRRSVSRPQAFELIFDRHFDAVHRFAVGRVGLQEAPDVAAETFARAFDRRARYRADRLSALPWLFGIAVNVSRERLRRTARGVKASHRLTIRPDQLADSFESDLMARVDAERLRPDLLAALRCLSDDEYALLMLAGESDLSYQDMAELLGIPIGTVRSRLARARRRVRSAITPVRPERSRHAVSD